MKPQSNYPLYTLVPILLLACSSTIAQRNVIAKVDEYVKAEMRRQKIPGVSLAIMKDGKAILAKGYGFANVEHKVLVKPETVFQSGSVGKQFTATAVMMLVEDGKIGLDEKISKYLGEVPDSWKPVTIRQLLSHTGGFTDYPDDFDLRKDYTEDELLKRWQTITLAFQPGEKWQYSNLGYVTLGILIHKVTGKFYGDFLDERIFKPLGMKTARIINEADIVPNRAAGYRLVNGELKNQQWVSPSLNTTADGSLYLTAQDMAKWDAALYGENLLKGATLEQMWTPVTLKDGRTHPYGFGWSLRTVNRHKLVEHGGSWQGFKAHIARYVDDKLTVIVFANLAQTNQSRIAHQVAAIIQPELLQRFAQDPEPQVTAQFKELLERLTEGKADTIIFGSELQASLFEGNGRLFSFIKTLGLIQSFQLLERSEKNGIRSYRYQVDYAAMTVYLDIEKDQKGKIIVFDVQPE